jgi:DNA-binding NarL/FixJ family response regulator
MLVGCNFLTTLGITALCDQASGYRVCGSLPTLPERPFRVRPHLVILNLAGLAEKQSALLFAAARDFYAPRPVVLLQAEGAGEHFPAGARCAIGMDDTAHEWLVTLEAALAGSVHFGPGTSGLERRAEAAAHEEEDTALSSLSRREKEVLDLTRKGLMPGEVARRLGRSVKTVEAHYQRVKIKLGLNSNAELREYLARNPAA